MNKIYAMLLAAMVSIGHAAPVAQISNIGEGGKARLVMHDTPCTSEVALKPIKTTHREFWKHGVYQGSDGKEIVACWTFADNMIVISDEEGDVGALPAQLVKKLDNIGKMC